MKTVKSEINSKYTYLRIQFQDYKTALQEEMENLTCVITHHNNNTLLSDYRVDFYI